MSVPLWMQATEMISLVFLVLFHFDGASPGRFLGSGSDGSDTTQCEPLLCGVCLDIFYNHLHLQNTFLFRPWVYGQLSVINKRKTWKLIFCWYGQQVVFQEEDFLWVSGIGFHPVLKLEVWKTWSDNQAALASWCPNSASSLAAP